MSKKLAKNLTDRLEDWTELPFSLITLGFLKKDAKTHRLEDWTVLTFVDKYTGFVGKKKMRNWTFLKSFCTVFK